MQSEVWAKKINRVIFVRDLGETPAMVGRASGTVYISGPWWNLLPKEQRLFILLHELGHLKLRTSNEKLVDAWAHREYLKRGYSLTQSIYALSRILNFRNPEHLERLENQYNRAYQYDKHVNKNPKTP